MASDRETKSASDARSVAQLREQKLALLDKVLSCTRSELLLVELDGLAPLMERKDALIVELTAVDQALETLGDTAAVQQASPHGAEVARLVEAILENEQTMETRIGTERDRLRKQLRDLDHQAQVRGYLERQRPRSGKVDLTR
ncbi:MAG TPA: hypothetical protein VF678_13810 [bacterium]